MSSTDIEFTPIRLVNQLESGTSPMVFTFLAGRSRGSPGERNELSTKSAYRPRSRLTAPVASRRVSSSTGSGSSGRKRGAVRSSAATSAPARAAAQIIVPSIVAVDLERMAQPHCDTCPLAAAESNIGTKCNRPGRGGQRKNRRAFRAAVGQQHERLFRRHACQLDVVVASPARAASRRPSSPASASSPTPDASRTASTRP